MTDGDICNDAESTEDALTLSDIEEDMLLNEDTEADTETLDDDDEEGDPDNVSMAVDDIDMSGVVLAVVNAETVCDVVASLLLEDVDRGEMLVDDDED